VTIRAFSYLFRTVQGSVLLVQYNCDEIAAATSYPHQSRMAKKKDKKRPREDEKEASDPHGEEDLDILKAAAEWADSDEEDTNTPSLQSSRNNLSLHITQLPFECTEAQLRNHFVAKGCRLKSVRLVYDRSGSVRTFRGVAFVDVVDVESYNRALKQLHQSRLAGRRINVRPTKSHEELNNIVERTKQIVADKKKKLLEARDEDKSNKKQEEESKKKKNDSKVKKAGEELKNKKQQGEKASSKQKVVQSSTTNREGKSGETKERPMKAKVTNTKHTKGIDRKLTRKERNRRAAIIMQQRKKT